MRQFISYGKRNWGKGYEVAILEGKKLNSMVVNHETIKIILKTIYF
jgi:hypothetical protein